MLPTFDKEIRDPELFSKVYNEFFNDGVVKVDVHTQGNKFVKDTLILGSRAAYVIETSNLVHEMAHMVEIDDERMVYSGWGLRSGTWTDIGIWSGWVTNTYQDIERECRVAAFQYNLQKHFGSEEIIENIVSSFTFIPGFVNLPRENEDYDASRMRWIVERTKSHIKDYSFDRFVAEWRRKIKLLADKDWIKERFNNE